MRTRLQRVERWIGRRLGHLEFVRVLLSDRLFTIVFAVIALLGLLVALAIPRIWRTTPKDFAGATVRVNWIDLIQARALAGSARRLAHAGDWEGAFQAWRSAMANNLGDPDLHRGLLSFLRDAPRGNLAPSALVLTSAAWLMGLTRTNASDLPLVADVLERQGAPTLALAFIDQMPGTPTDAVLQARARCLLAARRYDDFQRLWETHATPWSADPRMALYRDAWRAATDDSSAGIEASQRLRAALDDPGVHGLTAARLLLQVGVRRGSLEDLRRALSKLDDLGSSTPSQHAILWRALAASGQEAEARALARTYPVVPRDAEGAVDLASAFETLGMRHEALQFLERQAPAYGRAPAVWRLYLDLLARDRQWQELGRVASSLRVATSRNDLLYPEILLAEYRLSRGEDRTRDAAEKARELGELRFPQPEDALRFASQLREGGDSREAMRILQAHEAALESRGDYWTELFAVARELQDLGELRRSIDGLARADPANPLRGINRAALLLITGEQPTEALQLTFEALSRQPGSIGLRINHAIALVRNRRAEEADRLLSSLPADRLTGVTAANYHLAWAEVREAQGRWSDVLNAASKVDSTLLLPPQIERLDLLRREARSQIRR